VVAAHQFGEGAAVAVLGVMYQFGLG